MLGLLNFRTYTFIAAIVAVLMLAIWNFDTGKSFIGFVTGVNNGTAGVLGTAVAGFITAPIIWAAGDPLGAIVAGVLWPLSLFWLILFIALFVQHFRPDLQRSNQHLGQ